MHGKVAPGAIRDAAAEALKRAGGGFDEVCFAEVVVVAEEAAGVEDVRGGAPAGGVEVQDPAGHLQHRAGFQQVAVRQQGVFEDFAGGADAGFKAEGFLEDGDEDGAGFDGVGDVDVALWAVGLGGGLGYCR